MKVFYFEDEEMKESDTFADLLSISSIPHQRRPPCPKLGTMLLVLESMLDLRIR